MDILIHTKNIYIKNILFPSSKIINNPYSLILKTISDINALKFPKKIIIMAKFSNQI